MSNLPTWFVFVIFAYICAGCSWTEDPIPKESISAEAPFGISWDQNNFALDQRTSDRRDSCNSEFRPLKPYLDDAEFEIVIRDCIYSYPLFFNVSISQLPDYFSEGEVYGVMRDDRGPSAIVYSYLHRTLSVSEPSDDDRRQKHTDRIKRSLERAYGVPDASGVYVQGSSTGFVPQIGKNLPCDFWVRGDVAILLCSSRIVLIDGIEASLSFIKLSRDPYGDALAQYASGNAQIDLDYEGIWSPGESEKSMSHILLDWLGPAQYGDCDDEDLKPIDEVWTLPLEAQTKIDAQFGKYSGDELAMKAIEFAEDLGTDLDLPENQQKLMYLFKRASSEGSALAANEIGASLIHCYQGVRQDFSRAIDWLEIASAAGDPHAKYSSAKLITQKLAPADAPRNDALALLRECAEIDDSVCGAELSAMEKLVGAH